MQARASLGDMTELLNDELDGRVRVLNGDAVRSDGRFVLYWMNAARRARWNYALDRAIAWARELERPLVVLEALGLEYPYASDRLHTFVMQGMAANAGAFAATDALYYPYVEDAEGAGDGLIAKLGESACVVVTDDFPALFYPAMLASAGKQVGVRMEAVDSNGLLPVRAGSKAWSRAYDFRRFLQRNLAPHLERMPSERPFEGVELPKLGGVDELGIAERWPAAPLDLLVGNPQELAKLPIDHTVQGVDLEGGTPAARRLLERFTGTVLERYDDERNHPDEGATSGLSPYLHFGHMAAHEVVVEIARKENWAPDDVGDVRSGAREGYWNMSPSAEAYMDQLVTWRELGLNFATFRDDLDAYASLPDWAQKSLAEHATDSRPHVYSLEEFEAAATHEPVWNAAQRELVATGRMHNYMRMLWGKKILHWTRSPEDALAIMLRLNDRYALDGRDPNSYSGIFWVLGRYDRAWGPERPVFGKLRYMTCASAQRKLRLREYLERWA